MNIPLALILSRLVIGFVVLGLGLSDYRYYGDTASVLLTVGLLTDIFDGIIARRMGISTRFLRRMDSTVDQAFFVCIIAATWIRYPGFFSENALQLGILAGSEVLAYLVCYLKFRKEIATHSIGAKLWTLTLFATLVQVSISGSSGLLFGICFWFGILTRLEIIAILLALKDWANDIPSFYHALLIRQGKAIKRNKLFNG